MLAKIHLVILKGKHNCITLCCCTCLKFTFKLHFSNVCLCSLKKTGKDFAKVITLLACFYETNIKAELAYQSQEKKDRKTHHSIFPFV